MKNATIIAMTFATLLTTGLMAGNAAAEVCTTHTVTASGSSAGAIARLRKNRAERRAVSAWENKVKNQFGGKFADFDKAAFKSLKLGSTQRGNTSATARGTITVCR